MRPRLVLAGSVLVDLVLQVPELPERGGDMLAAHAEQAVGGGFNVLTAARRLGLPVVYGGSHGSGSFGDLVRAALAAEGIVPLLPARTDRDTGYCVALVDAGGERTFVTAPGAESALTHAEAGELATAVAPGDVVQLSGYGLASAESAAALTEFAATLPEGVSLCVDPGPLVSEIPPKLWERVCARVDWLSCNRREARLLCGVEEGAAAAEELLRRLRPGAGVVVRGDVEGCWLAGGGRWADGTPDGGAVHVPGRPVTPLDSNGAGDAHVAAFLTFLGLGATPTEAARGANIAASVSVTRRGPATGPTAAELASLLGPHDPLTALLPT